ncbi:hypothetical protein O988_02390 [Pseudogymnoascus sp. VKM F-3808]|nr:hypothetical protein O988_02390 [Pseudogymnoascus sp. VKM F-3808]
MALMAENLEETATELLLGNRSFLLRKLRDSKEAAIEACLVIVPAINISLKVSEEAATEDLLGNRSFLL